MMNKSRHKTQKLKHFKKDFDQIHEDLLPEKAQSLMNQPIDEELPGLGQFYCIECCRYMINQ